MPAVRTVFTVVLSVVALVTAVIADDPFGAGGRSPFGGEIDRDARKLLKGNAEVYEASKGAGDKLMLARVYIAVSQQVGGGLTRAEFVRRLKASEHFDIQLSVDCRTCNGWKRILSESSRRGPDGKIPCPRCRASGKRLKDYKVVWNKGMVTHKGDKRSKYLAALKRELGDHANSIEWLNRAKSYDGGALADRNESIKYAHAAYVEAMSIANRTWREKESKDSNWNKLQRQVIDRCLIGISETAPKYPKKKAESE